MPSRDLTGTVNRSYSIYSLKDKKLQIVKCPACDSTELVKSWLTFTISVNLYLLPLLTPITNSSEASQPEANQNAELKLEALAV